MIGRVVRLTLELPAGVVLSEGLTAAVRYLDVGSDGVIRTERPHPMRAGALVGTWAVIDEPTIPAPTGH
jgi:hypothetical protein